MLQAAHRPGFAHPQRRLGQGRSQHVAAPFEFDKANSHGGGRGRPGASRNCVFFRRLSQSNVESRRTLRPFTVAELLLPAPGRLAKVVTDYVANGKKTGGARDRGQVAVSCHLVNEHPHDSPDDKEGEGDVTDR